ncbi:MAG: preprotein translocase subunit SecG [Chlamydiales bacterium]|nr:preprotein translocase subunit SecG [Chlamydiales bacterium]
MMVVYYLALVIFVLISALLCGVILIQENKSMGLGASFGGDSGSSLFGTSTATVIKKITAWLAFFFFLGCVLLSFWTSAIGGGSQPVNLYPTTEDDQITE